MSHQTKKSLFWVFVIIFLPLLFIIGQITKNSGLVSQLGWGAIGLLGMVFSFDGLIHPTDTIKGVQDNRLIIFDKQFPHRGDEALVMILYSALFIFSLTIFIFGGILGWIN